MSDQENGTNNFQSLNEGSNRDGESTINADNTYPAGGVKPSFHGYIYQYQFLELFVGRCYRRQMKFKIAAEENAAGNFDDLVLYHSNGNDIINSFLQLKSKHYPAKNPITTEELKKSEGHFDLLKYYNSYKKINNQDQFRNNILKEFILCTNTILDPEAKNCFIEVDFDQDEILYFPGFSAEKFKINKDSLIIKDIFRGQDENDMNAFYEKFRIIIKYPNVDELGKLLEKEMGDQLNLIHPELPKNYFETEMINYLKSYNNGTANYYSQDDAEKLFKDLNKYLSLIQVSGHSKCFIQKLESSYPIKLKNGLEDLIDFLKGEERICSVKTETISLTAIKILKTLMDPRLQQTSGHLVREDGFLITTPKDLSTIPVLLDTFSSEIGPQLLVLVCEDGDISEDLSKKIQDALRIHSKKKVITISYEHFTIKEEIVRKEIEMEIKFEDLDEESQNKILSRVINFQGKEYKLNELVKKDDVLLNGFNCKEIINCFTNFEKSLKIDDSKAFSSPGYVEDYNIERKFERTRIDSCILTNKSETEIFFITGSEQLIFNGIVQNLKELENNDTRIKYNFLETTLPANSYYLRKNRSFLKVCEQFGLDRKNIHWLHNTCNRSELLWIKTKGNLLVLKNFIIPTHSSVLYNNYYTEEDFKNLIDSEEKYVILASEAGFGKSTVLTSLAKKIKSENPTSWIVRINLNNYAVEKKKSLDQNAAENCKSICLNDIDINEGDTEKAIDFLLRMNCMDDTKDNLITLKKELFLIILKQKNKKTSNFKCPKIVLMIDAFDEISPVYKEKTIKFLKALKQSSIDKIFITTHNHEKFTLENELDTPGFLLTPFYHDDQIDFLSRFWLLKLKFMEENDCIKAYEKILMKLKDAHPEKQKIFKPVFEKYSNLQPSSKNLQKLRIKLESLDLRPKLIDLNHFYDEGLFGTPLNLRMLAELQFNDNCSFAPLKTYKLFDLYDRFVNLRCEIYENDKAAASGTLIVNNLLELQWEMVQDVFCELAVKEILPESDYEGLPHLNAYEEFQKLYKKLCLNGIDVLLKIGLVVQDGQKLKFQHRTFADFFIGIYFCKYLHKRKVFEKIMFVLNSKFIRIFFEHQLKSKGIDEPLSTEIKKNIVATSIFHILIEEGMVNFLKCILKELKYPDSKKIAEDAAEILSNKWIIVFKKVIESNDLEALRTFLSFQKKYYKKSSLVNISTHCSTSRVDSNPTDYIELPYQIVLLFEKSFMKVIEGYHFAALIILIYYTQIVHCSLGDVVTLCSVSDFKFFIPIQNQIDFENLKQIAVFGEFYKKVIASNNAKAVVSRVIKHLETRLLEDRCENTDEVEKLIEESYNGMHERFQNFIYYPNLKLLTLLPKKNKYLVTKLLDCIDNPIKYKIFDEWKELEDIYKDAALNIDLEPLKSLYSETQQANNSCEQITTFEEFLLKNDGENNILYLAAIYGNSECLKFILEAVKTDFKKDTIIKLFNNSWCKILKEAELKREKRIDENVIVLSNFMDGMYLNSNGIEAQKYKILKILLEHDDLYY